MNAIFRTGDGTQINFKKTAEVVKYGAGTLKDALDAITGKNVTEFGGKILQTQNAAELLRLLKARKSEFYDEADLLKWAKVGSPAISSSGLSVSAANYLQTSGLEIGGNPFTIEINAKFPSDPTTGYAGFTLGTLEVQFGPANTFQLFVNGAKTLSGRYGSGSSFQNFEFGYSGGKFYGFCDGTSINTSSYPGNATFSRAFRYVKLGGLSGTIKFVRVSDGICRHTAAFTPATPQLDGYTKILFKFA